MLTIQESVAWINEALATRDIGSGMTYYCIRDGEICATNGDMTAGCPWGHDGNFLVPGIEFEKITKRMPGTIDLKIDAEKQTVTLKSKQFRGTITTLPLIMWDYPKVEDAVWRPFPANLLAIFKAVRPFVDEEASQISVKGIAIGQEFVFGTNTKVVVGAPCDGMDGLAALIPVPAVDFILGRSGVLTEWSINNIYAAFRWDSGVWMRTKLIDSQFPEAAKKMVFEALGSNPSQRITDEFRAAFKNISELADDAVVVYADRIESRCGKAEVVAEVECEVPESGQSLWGAKLIVPVMAAATYWSPAKWPRAQFKGEIISGVVMGRKA